MADNNAEGKALQVIQCVIPYLHDDRDRGSVSLVCRLWYDTVAESRKHVTVMCNTASPEKILKMFPFLFSLKVKGYPYAASFDPLTESWGGVASPWCEMQRSLACLTRIHFLRMGVDDSDLEIVAQSRGDALKVLKLDTCYKFSTDGLLHITLSCRKLLVLFLESSVIRDKDGKWLSEVALHNTELQELNFYRTSIVNVRLEDLQLIATNCSSSLVSMKVSNCEILELNGFFRTASGLQEFAGVEFNHQPEKYYALAFPEKLSHLGLFSVGKDTLPILFPMMSLLIELDLMCAVLDMDDHVSLINKCPNLEILKTTAIGDEGLEELARCCKRLRRLRIGQETIWDRIGQETTEEYFASHIGLIALARGCLELEYLVICVNDINNEALTCIGENLKNLFDFRLSLLGQEEEFVIDLPLDDGVKNLLRGCENLTRFDLHLCPGGLTDLGLGYIGKYGLKVRRMILACVGESDQGFLDLCRGCPNLKQLGMRGCTSFTENAMAISLKELKSLRFLWVQNSTLASCEVLVPFQDVAPWGWICELVPNEWENLLARDMVPSNIFVYYSIAGQRQGGWSITLL